MKGSRGQQGGLREARRGAGRHYFVFSLCVAGFLAGAVTAARSEATAVAEVNRVQITSNSVEREVRNYLRQIGHKELSPSRMMSLRKEMLERLIDEELIYQEAVKQGEESTPAEIDAEVDRIRKRFPAERDFEAALVRDGLTLDEIKQGVRRFILVRKMWNTISPSDEAGKQKWLEGVRKRSEIKIY